MVQEDLSEVRKKTKERKKLKKVKRTRKRLVLPQQGSLAALIPLSRRETQGLRHWGANVWGEDLTRQLVSKKQSHGS